MEPDHSEDTTEGGWGQHQGDGQCWALGVGGYQEDDLSDQDTHREAQAVRVVELQSDVDEYNLQSDE